MTSKAFIFHANEKYFDIIYTAILSVRQYSNLPIYVYLINSDKKIDISGVTVIKWNLNILDKFFSSNCFLLDEIICKSFP